MHTVLINLYVRVCVENTQQKSLCARLHAMPTARMTGTRDFCVHRVFWCEEIVHKLILKGHYQDHFTKLKEKKNLYKNPLGGKQIFFFFYYFSLFFFSKYVCTTPATGKRQVTTFRGVSSCLKSISRGGACVYERESVTE